MRHLVVGGAGFIGSTLVDRLLAEGQAVDVIDDLSSGSLGNLAEARADRGHEFTFHRLDVNDPVSADLIARRRPDVIYHLAVPLLPGDSTVAGMERLLDAAVEHEVTKVVLALDSRLLYGSVPAADQPVREGYPGRNRAPEGQATEALLDTLNSIRDEQGLEFTAVALGTVYGPRHPRGSVVSRLLSRSLARPAAPVSAGGSDETVPTDNTDLVFVDDVVDAIDRAASRGDGLLVNVGSGTATSLEELRSIADTAVARFLVEGDDRPLEMPEPPSGGIGLTHCALDISRAEMQLGWQPWTSVADGVAATIASEVA